jgi:hypothetical protein
MGMFIWTPSGNDFRDLAVTSAFLKDLHDHLLDAGLVQTEDTGQIDFDELAAVGRLTTSNYTQFPVSSGYARCIGYLLYEWSASGDYPAITLRFEWHLTHCYPSSSNYDLNNSTAGCPLSVNLRISGGSDGNGQLIGVALASYTAWHPNDYNGISSPSAELIKNGWLSVADDYLALCVNPTKQYNYTAEHQNWALPFVCIERQSNGDFHSSGLAYSGGANLSQRPAFSVQSSIDGVIKTLACPCAFIDAPSQVDGEPVIQKFYRYDRDTVLAEFMPLVAVPGVNQLSEVIEVELANEVRSYMSCGPDTGGRVSVAQANTWYPAMRVA